MLKNMQNKHNKDRKRDVHIIHHQLTTINKKALKRPQDIKVQEKKKLEDKSKKEIEEEKDKQDE